jgi:hypothetical protein
MKRRREAQAAKVKENAAAGAPAEEASAPDLLAAEEDEDVIF